VYIWLSFFFQAEDGIRDFHVTGVQTCALPIFTKIKPETMAAMVLTGIEGVPLHKVPPLELVVLHPDYAVVKLPMTVVDPLRGIGEEAVGAAAFIWSTVPDRGGPRDAFNVYQLLHEWQDFSHRLHEAGHQPYCLVWP